MSDWFRRPTRPELYAQELRHELGLTRHPLDIPAICRKLGVVYGEDSMGEGYDGALVWEEGVAGMLVNRDTLYPARKRFTGAHELGHFRIKHHAKQDYWCTSRDIEDFKSPKQAESEANHFASELLLPQAEVKRRLLHVPTVDFIESLASGYGTSLTATALKVVRLSQDLCALFMSDSSKILWHVASPSMSKRFGLRSGPLSPHSCAQNLSSRGAMREGTVHVRPDAWLAGANPSLNVNEDSVPFPSLGLVLSLVTVDLSEDELEEQLDEEEW